jgi:hypothetical protein
MGTLAHITNTRETGLLRRTNNDLYTTLAGRRRHAEYSLCTGRQANRDTIPVISGQVGTASETYVLQSPAPGSTF